MGIFSPRKKRKPKVTGQVSYSFSATTKHRLVSRGELAKMSEGWKRDLYDQLHTPDTVWVRPGSEVYHYLDCCCGAIICNNPQAMTEKQAIARGLRRCSKCRWGERQYP